jgi:hypothetical protein
MNIFVLDFDPFKCAWAHADVHVNKMILESCQLLSNALVHGPYKRTHYNHPCSVWARQTRENYWWLSDLTANLLDVYYNTTGKFHGCKDVFEQELMKVNADIPQKGMSPRPLCMPDQYKVDGDVVQSYRNYYCHKEAMFKRNKMTWKFRDIPEWYVAMPIN